MKNTALNIHKVFIVLNVVINGLFFFDQKLSENFQHHKYNHFYFNRFPRQLFIFKDLSRLPLTFPNFSTKSIIFKDFYRWSFISQSLSIISTFQSGLSFTFLHCPSLQFQDLLNNMLFSRGFQSSPSFSMTF